MVYEIGDFRVRVGDVRQTQPTARVRGTVVEIEWRGPSLVATLSGWYQSSRQKKARPTHPYTWDQGENDEDDDSGIDMAFPDAVEESDIDAEYAATASLIREFWAQLELEGAREAILVPDVGKEVKEQLRKLKQENKQNANWKGNEETNGQQMDEDPDPNAGADVARQFMEILRFNR